MSKIKKDISNYYQDFLIKIYLKRSDLYNSINEELNRQQQHIELIASENIVSKAVLDAQGSILTNKYAKVILVKNITEDVNLLIKLKS